jgi:hypothetical protein
MSEPNQPEADPPKPSSTPWQGGANPFADVPPTIEKPTYVESPFQPMVPPPGWRGDTINGLAIAGLVLSVLGAVTGICTCGIPGIIGLALAIPAFYMAQHDLAQFSHQLHPVLLSKLKTAKSLGLAGIIVGAIAIVLAFVCGGLQMLPVLMGILEEMN